MEGQRTMRSVQEGKKCFYRASESTHLSVRGRPAHTEGFQTGPSFCPNLVLLAVSWAVVSYRPQTKMFQLETNAASLRRLI